jgi:microcompartment protein CcmL/EutN
MERVEKSIAIVELVSVARGILVADEMLKGGDVTLHLAATTCPGKYLIVVGGNIGAVKNSLNAGLEVGKEAINDSMLLPNIHPDIFLALSCSLEVTEIGALGVVETLSAPATIEAADAAMKSARVHLLEVRLGKGMGAKSFFTFTGDISEVRTAAKAAEGAIIEKGLLVDIAVVNKPHADLPSFIV